MSLFKYAVTAVITTAVIGALAMLWHDKEIEKCEEHFKQEIEMYQDKVERLGNNVLTVDSLLIESEKVIDSLQNEIDSKPVSYGAVYGVSPTTYNNDKATADKLEAQLAEAHAEAKIRKDSIEWLNRILEGSRTALEMVREDNEELYQKLGAVKTALYATPHLNANFTTTHNDLDVNFITSDTLLFEVNESYPNKFFIFKGKPEYKLDIYNRSPYIDNDQQAELYKDGNKMYIQYSPIYSIDTTLQLDNN